MIAQTEHSLADLRTPENSWQHPNAFCPVCDCNKNGLAHEPNVAGEACTDSGCRCHRLACLDCEEPRGDDPRSTAKVYDYHPGCCSHDDVETDDIADGIAGCGANHVYASTCKDCGAEVEMGEEPGVWDLVR